VKRFFFEKKKQKTFKTKYYLRNGSHPPSPPNIPKIYSKRRTSDVGRVQPAIATTSDLTRTIGPDPFDAEHDTRRQRTRP